MGTSSRAFRCRARRYDGPGVCAHGTAYDGHPRRRYRRRGRDQSPDGIDQRRPIRRAAGDRSSAHCGDARRDHEPPFASPRPRIRTKARTSASTCFAKRRTAFRRAARAGARSRNLCGNPPERDLAARAFLPVAWTVLASRGKPDAAGCAEMRRPLAEPMAAAGGLSGRCGGWPVTGTAPRPSSSRSSGPCFLLMLFGTLEIARFLFAQNTVEAATAATLRQAIINPTLGTAELRQRFVAGACRPR